MGDNIHQLTTLPYANFDDEPSEDEEHAYDHNTANPSLNVDLVTSHGRKRKLQEKFLSMTKEKKITLILAVALVVLSVISIVYASIEKQQRPSKEHLKRCGSLDKSTRVDAGFGIASSRTHCLAWGGCWDGSAIGTAPKCYYPFINQRGYRVTNSTVQLWGMEIDLERIDELDKIFASEADQLKCVISYETDSRLRVKIFDPNSPDRYEVPMNSAHAVPGHRMQYILTITQQLFGFAVSRTHEASSTIFNTTMEGLIFSDQFLQLNMRLSSSNVYGLGGDHQDGLLRRMEFTYQSLWSTSVEKRHGAHPFLLHVEKDAHASGFFLQNSNAMDIILNPHPAITFRTTGGILDFYIFLGPTPADVISQFAHKIGNPFLPPLWALGYHFGSENFQTTSDFNITDILTASFPLDGIWAGKSLLKDNEEFTTDPERYKDIDQMIASLHDENKWFLTDTRPAVLKNSTFYSDDAANFVRDHTNKTLYAEVKFGAAVLLDYFHPSTEPWLKDALSQLRSSLQFDGLALEENEPTTQSNGSATGCSQNNLDNPVYSLKYMPKLKMATICSSAQHYGGFKHYDVHNIYGWKSSEVTKRVLSQVISDKRSLLLSRSSYFGSGVVSGHFVKENTASWEDMKHSIVVMLNYNMYGIPFVGANVCGYKKSPQDSRAAAEELCVRWHQLAVFYPFTKRYPSQETRMLAFSREAVTQITSAMKLRYKMLPMLYTLFFNAHTKGLPVVRPLFFDYLTDSETLSIETQFMFGESIMVAPVLKPGIAEQKVYFPADLWYDYLDPSNIISTPGYIRQKVNMDRQTYYVRGGHIVVSHLTTANNTKETNEKGDYVLDVYLSSDGLAFGELYTDDGISLHTISHAEFLYVTFNATMEHIRSEVTLRYPGHDNSNKIQQINIRGLKTEPTEILVKDTVEKDFTYQDGVLTVQSLGLPVVEAFMLSYS